MQPTKNPSTSLTSTTAYYLSFIVFGMLIAVEGPSLPVLASHTSSRLDQISLIFVFGSLGYMLGSLFGGRAYDRLPGHRFLAVAMLVIAAGAAYVPVISGLALLLGVMFILGVAKGALDVGCNILLQWTHRDRSGPYLNGLHFFFGVGSFLAPLLLAQILTATDEIHWTFWTIAALCLPLAAWFWFIPDPARQAEESTGRPGTMRMLPILLIVLCLFLYVGAEVGFGSWIYTYAITVGLGTTVTAAYLTSGFWGTFTIGRLLGIWISSRLPTHTVLILDLVGCIVSIAVIMIGSESAVLLWVGSLALGLCMASIFASTLMFAGERMVVNGAITGWFLLGAGVGGMFLPWLIGQAFVGVGPYSMLTLVLASVAAQLFLFLGMAGLKGSPIVMVRGDARAGE